MECNSTGFGGFREEKGEGESRVTPQFLTRLGIHFIGVGTLIIESGLLYTQNEDEETRGLRIETLGGSH